MAYPTTLALIAALWSGPGRTQIDRAVVGHRRRRSPRSARWSPARCSSTSGGARCSSSRCRWPPSPLLMAWCFVPAPRQRDDRAGRQPRRHPLGRRSSASLILAINFAPVPDKGALALGAGRRRARRRWSPSCSASARARTRCTTCTSPARRMFWVAACAGIIVFGSLMGAAFVSQQYLQNVLGYSTLEAGAAFLPAVGLHGPRRAALGEADRDPRGPVHAAARLRVPASRLR